MFCSTDERFYTPAFVEANFEKPPRWGFQIECSVVTVDGYDYRICEEFSHQRGSNLKKGRHGAGELNTDADPHRVERTGLLGEMAFAKVFQLPVDITYRPHGDKTDFEVLLGGELRKIDVKCSKQAGRTNWVDQTDQFGTPRPLTNDIYVFAYVESEDRESEVAVIVIMGYLLKHEVEQCPINPSPIPGRMHFNYDVLVEQTSPIRKLLEYKERI